MESTLQECDLDFVRRLVREQTGISIREDQEYIIVSRLTPLLRKVQAGSIGELVQRLQKRPGGKLQQMVMESMTNHETSFFRDAFQFEILKDRILPEIIRRNQSSRTLNIWSAACATGQEPYSVAMLINDHFLADLEGWELGILATDISERALQIAGEGQYNQLEINRGLPARLMVRHFSRNDAMWQIKPRIRELVEFRRLNLIEAMPWLPKMDIIFLRNALIYFDDEIRQQVLLNIHELLVDGGYLMLGVGESPRNHVQEYECISGQGTICFRKPVAEGAV